MSLAHITAIEDRLIRVRRRRDLQVHETVYQGDNSWVVKDPVALTYHRLKAPEIAVWNMLDGNVSLKQIQEHLQSLYPTKKIRLSDLQGLLSSFHKSGLVIADTVGQGSQMLHRHREKKRREMRQRFSNVLAIRFPGFDRAHSQQDTSVYVMAVFQVVSLLLVHPGVGRANPRACSFWRTSVPSAGAATVFRL